MSTTSQTKTTPTNWWRRTFGRPPRPEHDMDAALRSFAAATKRLLGLTPFETQLQAARLLAAGRAVEMRTGDGKTLAVAAAAAALALTGRNVHVATVNSYLARRDFRLFAPVLESLGLSVAHVADEAAPATKLAAYRAQIVYATGYTLGFDFLRDRTRLAAHRSAPLGNDLLRRLAGEAPLPEPAMQLDFVILDEVDSVLLDEACVPLLLGESGSGTNDDEAAIAPAADVAATLRPDIDFIVDRNRNIIILIDSGRAAIDARADYERQASLLRPWRQYIEHALTAAHLLRRDVDYVVGDDRIQLVDPTTGRIFDDRRWPEGLQRALEWKERLPASQPTVGAASITRAGFFRNYRSLSGISGTLVEATRELRSTFGLSVESIAPRLPSQLVERPTRAFSSSDARRKAVAAEANAQLQRGRPVLVGCRTIAESAAMSRVFTEQAIPHRVLDGLQTEAEATIIAAAGQSETGRGGTVTIATNMAGRGTDIMLDDAARRAGGLHVIGVERNDSARIDRQLLGRAGRQGDPGSGRFFVAADDALVADRPEFAAAMRADADAKGETSADYAAQWRQFQRAAETAARRRRTAAEHSRACREAATARLLR